MSQSNPKPDSGLSFTALLALLFIGLKLTGYITWPWIWVLSPIWIPVIIVAVLFLIAFILCKIIDR
jgi:hypothetical protein